MSLLKNLSLYKELLELKEDIEHSLKYDSKEDREIKIPNFHQRAENIKSKYRGVPLPPVPKLSIRARSRVN
ncbi:hypothetical protein LCGC14_0357760 [marine sediment metagenome]|uniref:Uncharacterized protein n=1 Tax=marine sediment metagenome TaxID=412755 RepID=A0A0F9VW14_9ZZZZ